MQAACLDDGDNTALDLRAVQKCCLPVKDEVKFTGTTIRNVQEDYMKNVNTVEV